MNLLLEGAPRSGKTTICSMIIEKIDLEIRGFITEEIRSEGKRVGFMVEFENGESRVLSHVDFEDGPVVSKYTVALDTMDWVIEILEKWPDSSAEFCIIDEIGKMELKHDEYAETVERLLDSKLKILATIPVSGPGFMEQIRQREDTRVIKLTRENWEEVLCKLVEELEIEQSR